MAYGVQCSHYLPWLRKDRELIVNQFPNIVLLQYPASWCMKHVVKYSAVICIKEGVV